MKRKLYTGLVTTRPPKELPGEALKSSLQELSSNAPSIMVPQEDSAFADRVSKMLLFDAALTPPDLPGAYGVPAWALDTARLIRASQAANLTISEEYGSTSNENRNALSKAMQDYVKAPNQLGAAAIKLSLATGIACTNQAKSLPKLDTWGKVVSYASKLAEQAQNEQHVKAPAKPKPGEGGSAGEPGEGEGEGEGDSDDDGEGNGGGDYRDREGDETDKVTGGNSRGGEETFAQWLGNPWSKSQVKLSPGACRPGAIVNIDKPDTLTMHVRRRKGIRRRPEMEGAYPRALHRLALDRKIFRGRPSRKGGGHGRGTVMVDLSSSMGWTEDDFKTLLEAIPECTVYGYQGSYSNGRIILLADRGKVADFKELDRYRSQNGGGNVVDVPALKFLSKMPKPRVWLSDGGATGKGDNRTQSIIDLCAEACVRGDIVRVRWAKDAARYILDGVTKNVHFGARAALMD